MSDKSCFFCATENNLKLCNLCDSKIAFCDAHEEYHKLPKTDNVCLPWKVDRLPIVGRILRTSRAVKKGELAIFDKAFSLGPMLLPTCLGCMQLLADVKEPVHCPDCNLPLCSLSCEFLTTHTDQECQIFTQAQLLKNIKMDYVKPNAMYNCISIMRMVLKLHRTPRQELEKSHVLTLMGHMDLREEDQELSKSLTDTHHFLKNHAKMDYSTEEAVKWSFGVLQTNAIGLPTGRALYPLISIMSHSCVPTLAAFVNPGQ